MSRPLPGAPGAAVRPARPAAARAALRLNALVRRAARPVAGRERDFTLYWVGTFWLMGAWGWTMPLLGVYLYEVGLGLGAIGVTQAVAGLLTFLSQAPLGHLSDRVGSRKRFLVAAVAAAVPLHALIPFTANAVLLTALMSAAGVATSAYVTMLYASVSSLARPDRQGRTFSAYRISGSLGWAVTTVSLAWVLGAWGVRGAFLLSAGVHALVAWTLWRWLPEPPLVRPEQTPAPAGAVPARPASLPGPRVVLGMRDVALFLFAMAFFTFSMAAGAIYLPIFVRIDLGAGDALFGTLMAVPAMFEVPFMLWLGRAGDRWGVRTLLLAGAAAAVVRWGTLSLVSRPAHLYPLQVLQSFAFSSAEILGVSYLSTRLEAAIRGTAMGLLVSFQALGRVTAPLVGGALGERAGVEAIFLMASAAAGAGGVLLALSGSRRLRPCAAASPRP